MSVDPSLFRAALGRFASGVTVVTARDDDGRDVGMTVSAFSALSLAPPLILLCVDHGASVAPVLDRTMHFAVNILAADQEPISRRFAEREVDRFDGVPFTRGRQGIPLLDGALAHIECRTEARHPGGDHTILVGEVVATTVRDGEPLIYHRGGYGRWAQ
ncbi:MAG: flavin reductase family protein [Gemmatimonadaceae bacterium]